jgi:hypothetical protein
MWIAQRPSIFLAILTAVLSACSRGVPEGEGEASRVESTPVIELVGGSSHGGDLLPESVPFVAYARMGPQIQSDVHQVPLPGVLRYRVGPIPEKAELSFGYAVSSSSDPNAAVDFEVTIASAQGESSALRETLSNLAHRRRAEVARIATQPVGADAARLLDGEFGDPWISPTSGPTRIDVVFPDPTAVTAFSMGTGGDRGEGGIPSRLRVAGSEDGAHFDRALTFDHHDNPLHQWHVLPGKPLRALRIWIVATHGEDPARIDELVLTTERDREHIPDQVGAWNRGAIDLAGLAGQEIEVSFRFGAIEPPTPRGNDLGYVSGPRFDLARRDEELNVVLISIDTVRADRLSAFGYDRPTTPFLEKVVEQPGAVRFTNVRSTSTWTPPSHLAMMVGRTPFQMNVHASRLRMENWQKNKGGLTPLAPSVPTLASILRSRGYKTFAFSSAGGTVGEIGLRNGFDVYDNPWNLLPGRPLDYFGETVSKSDRIDAWLERNRSRKFFLFLHTYVAHAPYKGVDYLDCEKSKRATQRCRRYLAKLYRADNRIRRGQEWGLRGSVYSGIGVHDARTMSDLYDGGLKLVDDFIERVFDTLDRLDLRKHTLVVITSDHGEPFAEHHRTHFDGGHGWALYDEYLRVPLVFLIPGLDESAKSNVPASLVDIPPTVLDLLGIESAVTFEGKSLTPAIGGDDEVLGRRPIFYEIVSTEKFEDFQFIAASKGEYKILANPYNLFDGHHELYDLELDPAEKKNIASNHREISQDLLSELDRHLASVFRGMVVLDLSTFGIKNRIEISGKIAFERPVRLFEIAARAGNEYVRPSFRKRKRSYEFSLKLRDERRLVGFRTDSKNLRVVLRLDANEHCTVHAPQSESKADGKLQRYLSEQIAVPTLPLQPELPRGKCSIGIYYVEGDPSDLSPETLPAAEDELADEDRERILEQMRALGYVD